MTTHMEMLSILPDLTVSYIIPLCIAETRLEFVSNVLESCEGALVELMFDFIEGNWVLDGLIVIWVLSL